METDGWDCETSLRAGLPETVLCAPLGTGGAVEPADSLDS